MSILHTNPPPDLPQIFPGKITTNAGYCPQLQDRKAESLQTQCEYLNLLRLRHLHWMDSADDTDIKLLHLDIAELIHKTTDQYHNLLELLREQGYEE